MKIRTAILHWAIWLLPLSARKTIDVASFRCFDVFPVLEAHCLHRQTPTAGSGYRAAGLSMETYGSPVQGTDYGAGVMPGESRHSL